jgi:nucleoside phosphorylase
MAAAHNPKLRFGLSLEEARSFTPGLSDGPPLPVVNYTSVGKQPPKPLPTPAGKLPQASAVVISWTSAEWAALNQVFCAGSSPMPYSARTRGSWKGWQRYAANLPSGHASDWSFWGDACLVEVGGKPVLLFKSNTHLDYPGAQYLEDLIKLMIADVKPQVILSVGTAGGANPNDHVGTVRAVSAGTLFSAKQPANSWPVYKCNWKCSTAVLSEANFTKLLFPVPTKTGDLEKLCSQFNAQYKTNYTLAQLDPNKLNYGDPTPQIDNQTGGGASLLTTASFSEPVGTTAGTYKNFTAIEMDDAIIGQACTGRRTQFGFVRNISDPVQSAALPSGDNKWGSAIYDVYGFYTSYNGALAAWAMLA